MNMAGINKNKPDEFQYATSDDVNLAIIRAYNEITFLDRMKPIMVEVAKILIARGADFSKCNFDLEDK